MLKSNTLRINQTGDLCYITFPAFEQSGLVNHAFTTRLGGVSKGQYSTMNMSFTNGDDIESVLENYNILCSAIHVDPKRAVLSHQTHTTNLRIVTEDDIGKGIVRERDYNDVDGLITNLKGIALVTQFADCVPLLFLDPKKKVIAASHAGWKGTVGEIGRKTVEKMTESFGCDPSDILAAIGPSIGQCCYEVDDPVYNAVKAISYVNLHDVITVKGGGKYMLNLWETNRQILLSAGILPRNITVNDICTCCNSDSLHSHRATGGKRGNLAAIIALR